jgi:type IV pilus assembly protein PilQ
VSALPVYILMAALCSLSSIASAQDNPAPVSPSVDKAKPVETKGEERFDLILPEIDVRLVLEKLATRSKRNITLSPDVKGVVTARLHDVTVDEAFEAILQTSDLQTSQKGTITYVFPKEGVKKVAPDGAVPVVAAHEINVAMTPDGTFLMKVENGDVRSVLLKLSALSGRNLILSPEVQGNLSLNLVGVTFDDALGAIVSSLNLAYEAQGNMIQLRSQTESVAMKQREVRVFHLSYLTSKQAKAYILGVISERGSIMTADGEMTQSLKLEEKQAEEEDTAASGDTSSFTATDDSLVVHDYRENLDKISDIIKRTDIRPDQVLIEATILSALLTDDTSLGVSFDAVMGSNFTDFVDGVGETTTNMLGGMNVPTTERRNLNYNTGRIHQGSNIGDMNGKNPFRLGVLMGDVSVFIEALDSITDITVIATPRLQVINRHHGKVLIGKRDGYNTSTTFSNERTESNIEFLETGTKLTVVPFIGKDGYVRLEVKPELSEGETVPYSSEFGSTVLIPESRTAEAFSSVLIRDGETMVLGGLFRENVRSTRDRIPGLGDLPFGGAAFGSTRDTIVREEVIILLTPYIQKTREPIDPKELDRQRKTRGKLGVRGDLRWNQSRLISDRHLRRSQQALRDGKPALARWASHLAHGVRPDLSATIESQGETARTSFWATRAEEAVKHQQVGELLNQEITREANQ